MKIIKIISYNYSRKVPIKVLKQPRPRIGPQGTVTNPESFIVHVCRKVLAHV